MGCGHWSDDLGNCLTALLDETDRWSAADDSDMDDSHEEKKHAPRGFDPETIRAAFGGREVWGPGANRMLDHLNSYTSLEEYEVNDEENSLTPAPRFEWVYKESAPPPPET